MPRELTVISERDEEGDLVAGVPAVQGCHTRTKSTDERLARSGEAIALCLEVQGEQAAGAVELVGIQKVAV